MDYDLDNCPRSAHALRNRISSSGNAGRALPIQTDAVIIYVDVDSSDVEKYRRLVGILDLESKANVARRVKAREASLNQSAEHKHQAGQIHFIPFSLRQVVGSPPSLQIMRRQSRYSVVIQNDIMAHPSRHNSVIARAVDGSKFKLEWYHKNYLDHVYAVSDDDGDILEHYRYTAFGEVTIYNSNGNQVSTTQIDNHILWNTRRRDELTGYYMYKFRHYSAELGRWLARDPIEEKGGVNLYAFVGNDGVNRWDRVGLSLLDLYDLSICCNKIDKGVASKYSNVEKDKMYASLRVYGTCCVDENMWINGCSGKLKVRLNIIFWLASVKDRATESVSTGRGGVVSVGPGSTVGAGYSYPSMTYDGTGGEHRLKFSKIFEVGCKDVTRLSGEYTVYYFDVTYTRGTWQSMLKFKYEDSLDSCGKINKLSVIGVNPDGTQTSFDRRKINTVIYENQLF